MPPARKAKKVPIKSTLGGLVDDSDQEDDLSITRLQTKPVMKKKATTTKTKAKAKASADATEPREPASKKQGRLPTSTTTDSPMIPNSTTSNKAKKPTAKPSKPIGSRMAQVLEDEVMPDATPTVRPKTKVATATKRKKAAVAPIDDDDEDMVDAPDVVLEKTKAKKSRIVKTAPAKVAQEEDLADELEPARKPRGRVVKKTKIVSEPHEDVEMMEDQIAEEAAVPENPATPTPAPQTVPASIARAKRRLAIPHSSSTVLSEASANQKLAEMKRKYDKLEARYNSLHEVGIEEAQNNYDKLKRQSEARAKTSTELIEKLKEEVAHQTALAEEGEILRAELAESEATIDELQRKLGSLEKLLMESRAENKSLATKLAASRAGDSINGIGSTSNGTRTMGANSELMQMAHMKEDLYGDLTGLYIRGVKRTGGEDVFDCLLSVRNWTLHFKLATDQEDGSGSGEYQEAMFTYRPQLDENRDKALIELLPEYLTDEIQFARPHSNRFYARVTQALSADKS
ncbi:hypothetical protein TD95_001407 [Thielaviopsis punctulata]|uniref:Monopolin complex subunit Csm1/Pcs1 C-terminal domain-containing protein n=1 Tax=Thielaviopsis punctulata TaxID=72032 RepID=A0A0F4Z7C3_9PEZI|nr:hypothetical protein TD95_001407 [Thielaviopsis punctulata]